MNAHLLTVIIILHNRHKNVHRLFEYYKECNFSFILADSSSEKHVFASAQHNWLHLYTPGYSFTEKIEHVLNNVETPYVAMCADDDFLLPEALDKCVTFFEQNSSYAIVQGFSIRYLKESVPTDEIDFGLIYRSSKSIEDDAALIRLQQMFSPYRSILYAVFKTEVLQYAFSGAGKSINNLYLNEYITAFIPIISGKYKELPLLYQIREYALDSDDKTATNLDTLTNSTTEKEQLEYVSFKDYVFNKINPIAGIETKNFEDIISKFSQQLSAGRQPKISLKKRIGLLIIRIPLLGNRLIKKSRKKEAENDLKTVIRTSKDVQNINEIKELLIRYH